MSTDMLALARASVDSHEDRLVLADLIEETGWWDTRIRYEMTDIRDREDFLSLMTWPGEMGEKHARVIVEALTALPALSSSNPKGADHE